jgi:hypothetical protein
MTSNIYYGAKISRMTPHTLTSTNELLAHKDEALLVRWNARLVGDLARHHSTSRVLLFRVLANMYIFWMSSLLCYVFFHKEKR